MVIICPIELFITFCFELIFIFQGNVKTSRKGSSTDQAHFLILNLKGMGTTLNSQSIFPTSILSYMVNDNNKHLQTAYQMTPKSIAFILYQKIQKAQKTSNIKPTEQKALPLLVLLYMDRPLKLLFVHPCQASRLQSILKQQ